MIVTIKDGTGQSFHLRQGQIIGVIVPGLTTPGPGHCTVVFGTSMAVAVLINVDREEAERVVKLLREESTSVA